MYTKTPAALGVLLALGVLSTPTAFAQQQQDEAEKGIEKITVTGQLSHYSATKSDVPIMETSRSVSIETIDEITEKGALNLSEALTYSAGVIGNPDGFDTRNDSAKVRGLRVPQYQDSLQSLFGYYNNTRPDIYTLEQVEVLKGPASVLYGKGSPGGIINVVSKTPKAEAAHQIVAEIGSHSRKQFAFDSTGAINEDQTWLYRAVGVYRDTDTQVNHVSENAKIFMPSLTWRPSDKTDITLLLNYAKVETDTALQFLPIYGTLYPAPNGKKISSDTYLGDPDFNLYNPTTKSATLLASHEFNDTWRMEVTARHTRGETDYQQAWPSFIGGDRYIKNPDGSLYKDGTVPRTFYRADNESRQSAIDTRLRGELTTGDVEHQLLMGVQYQDVSTKSSGFYGFGLGTGATAPLFGDIFWVNVFNPTYGNYPNEQIQAQLEQLAGFSNSADTKDKGIYISDQITYNDWLFNVGLRYDEVKSETPSESQNDDALSASLGIMYQFENGVSPYINYAQSFEPITGDNAGKLFKPQEGEQFEVGMKYQAQNFPAFVTVAYFDLTQNNMKSPQTVTGTFDPQTSELKVKGLEIEAKATFDSLTAEVNLTQLDHENELGKRIASMPEKQASVWLNYQPEQIEGLRIGGGVRYVGENYGGADIYRTPSYTLLDFMVGYSVQNWDFSVNVRNASDKEFVATCLARGDCFYGERRNVVGRVTYNF